MKHRAVFKYNSGMGALLCSKCSAIIKEGRFFTEEEWKACRGEIKIPPQYCDECAEKLNKFKVDE